MGFNSGFKGLITVELLYYAHNLQMWTQAVQYILVGRGLVPIVLQFIYYSDTLYFTLMIKYHVNKHKS